MNRRKARGSGLRLRVGGWGKYAVVDLRRVGRPRCSCLEAARGPPCPMATAVRSLTAPDGAARFDNRVDVNLPAMPRLQRNPPGHDALPEFAAARRGGRTPRRSEIHVATIYAVRANKRKELSDALDARRPLTGLLPVSWTPRRGV